MQNDMQNGQIVEHLFSLKISLILGAHLKDIFKIPLFKNEEFVRLFALSSRNIKDITLEEILSIST